ncbi:uncharacterized mitochondrial protein AtMg00810-like [Impatiens glandulifera]|uniref:uncharacterized mitochondrial protein AtMg00810-like n=1 Tax=Impatiens glandulifera TaxID=253017 RepID=UPI001FB09FFC|nr:uncharacterized mitochondrial protein AtMg00810-like [Impatiens glandulifera]
MHFFMGLYKKKFTWHNHPILSIQIFLIIYANFIKQYTVLNSLLVLVTRTKDDLFLSQSKYIDNILTRADMLQAKPLHTPVSAASSLSKHDGDPLSDPFLYRSIVGALQYLTLTRLELAFAVNRACQFMQTPTSSH